ncbi:hypothetical protein ABT364_22665 [Massilia sp. SR12]
MAGCDPASANCAHIINTKRLPATIEEAGYKEGLPVGVRSIVVNQQTAPLEITMDKPPVAGQTFYMAPAWDKDGSSGVACTATSSKGSCLRPAACRYSAAAPFRL